MPAISVLVDGEVLAIVNTDNLQVLTAYVHGARTDEDFATIDFHGMTAGDGNDSTYLAWIDVLVLQPGQEVEFQFLESGETTSRGRTAKELQSDGTSDDADSEDSNTEDLDFNDPAQAAILLNRLRAKPSLRAGYAMQLFEEDKLILDQQTTEQDHAFSCGLLWNSFRPHRASMSLHAYTIDDIEKRSVNYMVREYVQAPRTFLLRVDALAPNLAK